MREVLLRTTSSYAAELRPLLRPQVFLPAPLRLLWLPVHYAVIVLGTLAIARSWLPLPLQLVVSLLIGASFAGLTFVGHEALHGALVRNRPLRRLLGRLGFLPFAVPPSLWEAWHNRVHHGNTNRAGVDPDAYPSLAEYSGSRSLRRVTDWLAPGRSRLAGAFSLLVGFTVQSSHMLLTAKRRGFLKAAEHRRALLEAGAVWALWGVLAVVLGPVGFVLAFGLPLIVANTIIMSFILTNHSLSPHTQVNDPLVNSLSVVGPRFFQWLTLGFGFHVEHHLFPAVSGRHGRELSAKVRHRFPERYQSLPYFRALLLLHRSPRVYRTDTLLFDPVKGGTWPTLAPSTSRATAAVPRRAPRSGAQPPTPPSGAPLDAVSVSHPSTRNTALVLSFTASIACTAPPLRVRDAEEPLARPSDAPSASLRAAQPPDAADAFDAHHAPPATTSTVSVAAAAASHEAPVNPSTAPGASSDETRRDADIEPRIRRMLGADRSISAASRRVRIVTRGGRVTLYGPVRTEVERSAVETAVMKVDGVVQIDSHLVVEPASP